MKGSPERPGLNDRGVENSFPDRKALEAPSAGELFTTDNVG
jgi:hypothetical protein